MNLMLKFLWWSLFDGQYGFIVLCSIRGFRINIFDGNWKIVEEFISLVWFRDMLPWRFWKSMSLSLRFRMNIFITICLNIYDFLKLEQTSLNFVRFLGVFHIPLITFTCLNEIFSIFSGIPFLQYPALYVCALYVGQSMAFTGLFPYNTVSQMFLLAFSTQWTCKFSLCVQNSLQ